MYRLATLPQLPPRTIAGRAGWTSRRRSGSGRLKPVAECNAAGCPTELAELIHRCLSFNALKRPGADGRGPQAELDRIAERLAASGSGSHKVLEW